MKRQVHTEAWTGMMSCIGLGIHAFLLCKFSTRSEANFKKDDNGPARTLVSQTWPFVLRQ